MICDITCLVSLFQYIALGCAILIFILYRVIHPPKPNPVYRIEKVIFDNGTTIFYCSKRHVFNRWKSFEIEEGIKGYQTLEEAKKAIEDYLRERHELIETTIEKEYYV